MENNNVFLHGIIKRDAEARPSKDDCYVLDFTVKVWNENIQRWDNFDCRTTNMMDAYDDCQGYLSYNDKVTLEGCLERFTTTQEGKIGDKKVTISSTNVLIFVDNFIDIERANDEY